MLLNGEIILETPLELSSIINILQAITSSSPESNSNNIRFHGKIGPQDFILLPTTNYSKSNRVRPEIKGEIKSGRPGGKNLICLQFALSQEIIGELRIAAVINSIIILCFLIMHEELPAIVRSSWWLIFVAIITFLTAVILTFRARVAESIELLKRILKAEEKAIK